MLVFFVTERLTSKCSLLATDGPGPGVIPNIGLQNGSDGWQAAKLGVRCTWQIIRQLCAFVVN